MKLTQTDRKDIVTALQSGNTTAKTLAAKYGVSDSTIGLAYKQATGKSRRTNNVLSLPDKEAIVAELLSKKSTTEALAGKYGVGKTTIIRTFIQMTGKPLKGHRPPIKTKMAQALRQRTYRAWHKTEQKMYEALGIDWFNQKVLIDTGGVITWRGMVHFYLMEYSGLRDRKRTPAYPEGKELCAGDIVLFPILLRGNNGKTTEQKVLDIVALDRELAGFIVSELDDPLAIHSDECEIIGNIYANPELLSETKTVPDKPSLTYT